MNTSHWGAWIAGGLIAAAGCTGSVVPADVGGTGAGSTTDGAGGAYASGSTTTGTGPCAPPVPQNHRPQSVTCAPSTPTPNMPAVACKTDADCPPGGVGMTIPGHCDAAMTCDYNLCATDSDCFGTQACICQAQSAGGFGGPPVGSTCIAGTCRVDADCGAGDYCSPTVDSGCGNESGIAGYYCHTCQDTCTNDSDCPAMPNSPPGYCAFDHTVGYWACGYGVCSG